VFGLTAWSTARAEVAVLMEEPYGTYGKINPTGHAAIYLNHVCASAPTELRPCRPGEAGVVISRYYHIGGYDWIAMPLIPYLYAVNRAGDIPATATPELAAQLRDAYRRRYLETLAPDGPDGATPRGEWTDMLGLSYIRKIYGLNLRTTKEQDEAFIAIFNDRRNQSHFNLVYRNCADFTRKVLNIYFPGAVHRNILGDAGVMTPKQVAKAMTKYGREHPELELTAFVIPQVPGSIQRSRAARGVSEGFLKSKKYILPLTLLSPEITAVVAVDYMARDRYTFPKNAEVLSGDKLVNVVGSEPGSVTAPLPDRTAAGEAGMVMGDAKMMR
jgi:hypothetical protein